jgi:multiple sugar transport system permease protein
MTDAPVRASAEALMRAETAYRPPRDPVQILRWTLLAMGAIVMVMPIVYMLSASFKYPYEMFDLNIIPREPTLENYIYVLADGRFVTWFVNSLIIATLTTVSAVFFDSLVGYTLCKFRFRGRYLVFIAILSTLMIPTEMLVIPWYLMSKSFGWLDTYWGIMFPGMMTAFGVFLMKQFFETVPDDFI